MRSCQSLGHKRRSTRTGFSSSPQNLPSALRMTTPSQTNLHRILPPSAIKIIINNTRHRATPSRRAKRRHGLLTQSRRRGTLLL
ncbi:hypothetical protein PRUPE_6G148200 [Prunus persica]|uniref:Uncharacterized protein n=1 Tax=Prunus persica TaxID=3760 RepID=A0A251NQK7_PRUPE|nr:hypothetical protein PRUPE_6G148200 [Prunus persica]